jgi:uncharacterized protein YbbC (DUF1343 family)
MQKIILYLIVILLFAVQNTTAKVTEIRPEGNLPVLGAEQTDRIKDLVKNRQVGLIMNQTSRLPDGTHLLDTLLKGGLHIRKIFAPEHGFRGTDDAGAEINAGVDSKTGIPIVSLYGKNHKPTAKQLADIEVLIFDIQDVGARFYTYISTMHYAMEACAKANRDFIVLDRPNPNDYVDGPVRRQGFSSFVGVDPVPVLHGLTVGELARMINGEGWLSTGKNSCRLHVVPLKNWRHGQPYSLPVKPSPNLPNDQSVRFYPSLCFFEGTNISVGRGTLFPFQLLGNPDKKYGPFTFVPRAINGMDTNPVYKGKTCYGEDLRDEPFDGGLSLRFVIRFFEKSGHNEKEFFSRAGWFDLLAGTDSLRKQIVKGLSEKEIRASWETDLDTYKQIRKKYLLYDDYNP